MFQGLVIVEGPRNYQHGEQLFESKALLGSHLSAIKVAASPMARGYCGLVPYVRKQPKGTTSWAESCLSQPSESR